MTVSKASDITAKLLEPFPVDVIEEKNGLLYIPHEIIRDRLISATDNQFDWSIDQILFRDDGVTRLSLGLSHGGQLQQPDAWPAAAVPGRNGVRWQACREFVMA